MDDGAMSFSWDFERDEYSAPLRPSPNPTSSSAEDASLAGNASDFVRQRKLDMAGNRDVTQSFHGQARAEKVSPVSPMPPMWKHVPQEKGGATQARSRKHSFSSAQVYTIRQQLDAALDRWWAVGDVPPLFLLRDGLLLLESGESLAESVRTLLLRTALVYNRGIKTALRYQVDLERVALILAEAGVDWATPIAPSQVAEIVGNHAQLSVMLAGEIERKRALFSSEQQYRADALLAVLPKMPGRHHAPPPSVGSFGPEAMRRAPFRRVLLLLLLVALVGFVLWEQRKVLPPGMVAMPAATYALLPAAEGGDIETMVLGAFFIDRFEVTNREYRTCVDQRACVWPVRPHSETRRDYFTNPAFDGHPVVAVTQEMATAYCLWQGKRLPSVGEWQAAASVSSATGQAFRFPWGQTFDVQRANSAVAGLGDTVAVGSFRPGGDSPSGVSDMAGNVAEWTSTLVNDHAGNVQAIVKGGSFMSEPDELAVGAQMYVAVGQGFSVVGFRCVRN